MHLNRFIFQKVFVRHIKALFQIINENVGFVIHINKYVFHVLYLFTDKK